MFQEKQRNTGSICLSKPPAPARCCWALGLLRRVGIQCHEEDWPGISTKAIPQNPGAKRTPADPSSAGRIATGTLWKQSLFQTSADLAGFWKPTSSLMPFAGIDLFFLVYTLAMLGLETKPKPWNETYSRHWAHLWWGHPERKLAFLGVKETSQVVNYRPPAPQIHGSSTAQAHASAAQSIALLPGKREDFKKNYSLDSLKATQTGNKAIVKQHSLSMFFHCPNQGELEANKLH